MIVYNFNSFNGRYYCYDADKYDVGCEMFDWNLHDNAKTPQIENQLLCGYCGVQFVSRNRLFYHLGFMNINTNKKNLTHSTEFEMDENAGDHGFVTSKRRARKLLQFHKTIQKRRTRSRILDLSRVLSKLSVNNTK